MANLNLKFLRGLQASLPTTGTDGYFYLTTDTHRLYTSVDGKVVPVNEGVVTVANIAALNDVAANAGDFFYATEENVLCVFNGQNFIQINAQKTLAELGGVSQTAYNEKMTALEKADTDNATAISGVDTRLQAAEEKLKSVATTEGLGELTDRVTTAEGEIDALQAASHTHTFADTDVEDAISKKHSHTFADADVVDAISKKHSHTFVESELNKIAAGDVAKWNGVVADHLTAADKDAIEDEIGDVNTALENYKTSNNEALAGVKATAEAAATKDYTDTELGKKVAKADYEADKATFATKTELSGVDAKFANYKTAADQKLIDDAQDVEIGKKVDKVTGKSLVDDAEITKLAGVSEGANKVEASTNGKIKIDGVDTVVYTHPDKHTVSEISDFETKIASYNYATKTEAQGYANAKDDAIAAAKKTADDITTYVGTFTASEGVDTVVKYIDAKTANIASDERVNGIDNRVKAIEDDYLVEADIANFETKENVKKVADDLGEYKTSNDAALAEVRGIADAARTEDEVNSQIDAKITALDLANTYEPKGAEQNAKNYVDQKFTDANLAQYTTEQEVKDIVDGVIAGAADSETYNSLTKLVDYIDTHGGEATEMAEAIDALEGDVKGLKEAPSASIKATDIAAWNGEIGAKALAETKLDASTFTTYEQAHASDYTNKQIDDAIDADVKTAIDAEVLRANGAYDANGAAATAKSEAIADAATKYETIGTAQGIVNGLKLSETYEPIGAEGRAIAAAKTETETQVKALAGEGNTSTVKKNADDIASIFEQMQWGSF